MDLAELIRHATIQALVCTNTDKEAVEYINNVIDTYLLREHNIEYNKPYGTVVINDALCTISIVMSEEFISFVDKLEFRTEVLNDIINDIDNMQVPKNVTDETICEIAIAVIEAHLKVRGYESADIVTITDFCTVSTESGYKLITISKEVEKFILDNISSTQHAKITKPEYKIIKN